MNNPVIVVEPNTAFVYRVRYRRGDILFCKRLKISGRVQTAYELTNFDEHEVIRFREYIKVAVDIQLDYLTEIRSALVTYLTKELKLVKHGEFGDICTPHPLVYVKARKDFQNTRNRAIKDIEKMLSDLG